MKKIVDTAKGMNESKQAGAHKMIPAAAPVVDLMATVGVDGECFGGPSTGVVVGLPAGVLDPAFPAGLASIELIPCLVEFTAPVLVTGAPLDGLDRSWLEDQVGEQGASDEEGSIHI
ncbi:uncharacterized protein PGTG_06006 [Puccinia graminis f. sp. tritici CRL 75-36-700-3]|uniref:Uncharacterized protein n=1 Tax=Puccinia graminis f. sp. tritici (strain CRL 75-36-700-3 / race SCCL) TaxID=418459 RepID=E3K589_PUCGT|nr:uncharacterized protein PGTG_06006 [Puccinia graminis f. sp. tritici CRL 75-36-700-3]EFP79685.1 hypothetical protein PGTG_06006 [Puccinia graminis f. sp. tritici CRL 75-36-700-3]